MKSRIYKYWWDLSLVFVIIGINVWIHNYNLSKNYELFTDSGVYLYAAELIKQGHLPYRDFFLSHPPLLIYIGSLCLTFTSSNILQFHQIYILWFFSSLLPLYFLTFYLTKNRFAGCLSLILFSTFPELIQWDAHTFALRHASIPFLIYSFWFLIQLKKQIISAIFLALFATTTISNLILSQLAVISVLFLNNLHLNLRFAVTLYLIIGVYYITVLVIPNAFDNIFLYQTNRYSNSFTDKLTIFQETLRLNWPILTFGLLGSLIALVKKKNALVIFNLAALPITVFANSFFYGHYITILAPTYAVGAAYLLTIHKNKMINLSILIFCIFWIISTGFNYLYFHLYQKQNSSFYQTVALLNQHPGNIFTLEPIFALQTHKQIPHFYYASDSKSLLVAPIALPQNYFDPIILLSDIILFDNRMGTLLPEKSKQLINQNFTKQKETPYGTIYIHNQ